MAYVFPAGAQRGDTLKLAIGGQRLADVTGASVSGDGVTVKSVELAPTLNEIQLRGLRKSLRALERARPTVEIVDLISEIRRQLALQQRPSPAVLVEVAVEPDATPGPRELRLMTRSGLTNPLQFCIGGLPEVREGEMTEVPLDVQVLRDLGEPIPLPEPDPALPTVVKLPAVVNGQILPGETDRYRFEARRGQKIVVVVEARRLIPYIADAVPGWFEAVVSIRDTTGHELGYADHFRFDPDPVLCVEIPADGAYVAEVRDSIYRGREDFVYRMTIGELPFVTDIYPLGCRAGTRAEVEMRGWNLPAARSLQDTTTLAPGVHRRAPLQDSPAGNPLAFEVGDIPEIAEAASHGTEASAQALRLPVTVNGRINPPGQWDVFRFEARAGEEVVAEVRARRLGSPLDSVLILTDAGGRQVAANDDSGDNREAGLETHHADSYLRAPIAVSGTYYLHLGDIGQHGGPEYAYRLRVSAPNPDFQLRIAPSGITLYPGRNVPVTVYALRKDGFAGDIGLFLKDAPAGLSLSGGRIGGADDRVRVTLAAQPTAAPGRFGLRLQGRATIAGQTVVREALPVDDMEQAFLWRHLVPARDQSASVLPSGFPPPTEPIKLISDLPVAIPAGSSASVQVGVPRKGLSAEGPVRFELVDPPAGISTESAEADDGHARMVLACDASKLKPGAKGNLIAVAFVMVVPPPRPATAERRLDPPAPLPMLKGVPPLPDDVSHVTAKPFPDLDETPMDRHLAMQAATEEAASAPEADPAPPRQRPPQRVTLGTLPAIPFEIVAP